MDCTPEVRHSVRVVYSERETTDYEPRTPYLYRTIPTLAGYVLVSVGEPRVLHFSLKNDHWEFRETAGLGNSVYLPSVETNLALSDIYTLIEWEQGKEQE